MSSTEQAWCLQLYLPLPPMELSKNGRANPFERNRLYQSHKMVARSAINRVLTSAHEPWTGPVTVHLVWRYKRNAPDRDNAIERVACYVDAAEECGLMLNDKQVSGYQVDYIKSDDEGVSITFTHDEEAE